MFRKLPFMLYAILAAVLVFTLPALASHHQASSGHSFMEPSWTTHVLDQSYPAEASWAYNNPASFGSGAVQDGFATTAVTRFTSYATFAAQVGQVTTKWVMYDDESWPQTPPPEQQNPAKYLRLFAQLAHAHGLKVIEAPARDLAETATTCRANGLDANHWYIKCGMAAAAAGSNVVDVQDQANMGDQGTYDWFYTTAAAQAHAVNPGVAVYPQVSDAHGSPAVAFSDITSVSPPGVYIHVANADVSWEAQLIDKLQSAW